MDENNEYETTTTTERKEVYDNSDHTFWKLLASGLLIFLATFCAAYTVLDWHMKSMIRPPFMHAPFDRMDKMIRHDMKMIDKSLNETMREEGAMFKQTNNIIHMEKQKSILLTKIN